MGKGFCISQKKKSLSLGPSACASPPLPSLPTDSSSSTQPSQLWLDWPSGGCVPSSWVGRSPMRAWTWWLLPFSCTLSPSPLPGDVLHLSPGQEVPLGSAIILAASVHMGEVTEPRGRRGSKTPPPLQSRLRARGSPDCGGLGTWLGP